MAFSFAGDTIQSQLINETLEAKVYAIPGVTCLDTITVVPGQSIRYWVNADNIVSAGTPGAKHTYNAAGLTAKTLTFDATANVDAVIPGASVETVSANTVNSYVVNGTVEAANTINRDFLTQLEAAGQAGTAQIDLADVYGSILSAKAEFIKTNKKHYMRPTAMFVSPEVKAALDKNNLVFYKEGMPFGSFSDMLVIEAPDLASDGVVIMNYKGMVAAQSYDIMRVVDATTAGFPGGTLIAGEIMYKNAKAEVGDASLKPVMKFAKKA